jgi:hypothetical protein
MGIRQNLILCDNLQCEPWLERRNMDSGVPHSVAEVEPQGTKTFG